MNEYANQNTLQVHSQRDSEMEQNSQLIKQITKKLLKQKSKAEQSVQSKKEVEKKGFMTRADFMENLKIPCSSKSRIVIPSNQDGNRFLKHCYVDEYLEDYISKDEFDDIIEEVSKIAGICFTQKRHESNKKKDKISNRLFYFASFLLITFLYVFYRGVLAQNEMAQIFSIACLFLALGIVFFVTFTAIFTGIKVSPQFNEMVKISLDQYFSELNSKCLEKGLYWRVVPGHYWVELRIDTDLKNDRKKINRLQKQDQLASQGYDQAFQRFRKRNLQTRQVNSHVTKTIKEIENKEEIKKLGTQKTLMRKETKRFEKKKKEIVTKEKIFKRPSFVSESDDMVIEKCEEEEEQLDFEPRPETNKNLLKVVNFNPILREGSVAMEEKSELQPSPQKKEDRKHVAFFQQEDSTLQPLSERENRKVQHARFESRNSHAIDDSNEEINQ